MLLAIVEQVREGTSLRVRLLMPDGEHQLVNVLLAGVRSPKIASKPGEVSEQWGEEVGYIMNSMYPLPSQLICIFFVRPSFSLNHVFFNVLCVFKYYLCLHQPVHPSKLAQMEHLRLPLQATSSALVG